MTIRNLYPDTRPSLNLDFANSKQLDPRITFTRGSIGTYTDESGIIRTAVDNEARFDHDSDGNSLGLLIEESRTNYIADSSTLTGWGAVGTNGAVVASTTVCPDGSTDGIRITGTLADEGARKYFTAIAATYIGSCYARSRTGSSQDIKIAFSGLVGITQTLPASGEWVRIQGNPGVSLGAGSKYLAVRAVSDGTLDIDVWGEQAEVGFFPTSYIPTAGSTVTRSPDVASITGTNFSNWYNQSEGTLLCDYRTPSSQDDALIWGLNGATDADRVTHYLRPASGGDLRFDTTVGGTLTSVIQITNTRPDVYKTAIGIAPQNIKSVLNGGVLFEDTGRTGDVPTVTQLFIGTTTVAGTYFGLGHVSRIAYYPVRLTDEQLQILTL